MTKRPNWWQFAREKEPDIENLKQILNDDNYDFDAHDKETEEFRYEATQLKYEAMAVISTAIEKTMTPEQLFKVRSHYGRVNIPFNSYIIMHKSTRYVPIMNG